MAFLRSSQLLHMDGHFGNMRTDGKRIYLTDFGLATSPRFDLSAAERDFARRHTTHDAAYAAMRLVNWLVTTVCGVPVPAGGRSGGTWPAAHRSTYSLRAVGTPPVVATILTRHAPAAARMNSFYWRLFDGDLSTEYPGP